MAPEQNPTATETAMFGRGFWDFCHDHPVAFVFAILFIAWGCANIAAAITGHWQPDDFWKYQSANGCKQ